MSLGTALLLFIPNQLPHLLILFLFPLKILRLILLIPPIPLL